MMDHLMTVQGFVMNGQEKDQRIKVIHKENGGLSDARNAGMQSYGGCLCIVYRQ